MSRWSLWFVAAIFTALGASFLISTGSIFREFEGAERVTLLAAHSHLFVFFPTLGIVALAAFYIPAAIFTDLYFTGKARLGVLRFFAGFVAAILLSIASAGYLNSDVKRAIWELSPTALDADLRRGVVCGPFPARLNPWFLSKISGLD